MNLPNFLCIGVQKSGTTLLYDLLKENENIYLPNIKETHFFDDKKNYEQGLRYYSETFFSDVKSESGIGEVTPSYIFIDEVAKRVSDSLGKKVKFIVILRNPIDRAYSHYIMRYTRGEESESFSNAIMLEERRIKENFDFKKKYSYILRGYYFTQIQEYFKYFDKENFLFIEFEYFVKNQNLVIGEVCDFLYVGRKNVTQNRVVHNSVLSLKSKIKFSLLNKNYNIINMFQNSSYPDMGDRMRDVLREVYKNDIQNLEKLINKDLSSWLQ